MSTAKSARKGSAEFHGGSHTSASKSSTHLPSRMNSGAPSFAPSQIGDVAVRALRVAWYCIRMPLAAILALLEPIVRAVLTLGAALCIFTALFFEVVSRLPTHSLLALLGAGFACAVILALYQHVVLLLTR